MQLDCNFIGSALTSFSAFRVLFAFPPGSVSWETLRWACKGLRSRGRCSHYPCFRFWLRQAHRHASNFYCCWGWWVKLFFRVLLKGYLQNTSPFPMCSVSSAACPAGSAADCPGCALSVPCLCPGCALAVLFRQILGCAHAMFRL